MNTCHLFQLLNFRIGVSNLQAVERPPSDLSSSPSLPSSEWPIPIPATSVAVSPIESWKAILSAPWRHAHQLEPVDHNRRPILMDWLKDISPPESKERTWMCQVPSAVDITQPCGKTFPRWDRGLTHIRSEHLHLRPFLCGGGGNCKAPNW